MTVPPEHRPTHVIPTPNPAYRKVAKVFAQCRICGNQQSIGPGTVTCNKCGQVSEPRQNTRHIWATYSFNWQRPKLKEIWLETALEIRQQFKFQINEKVVSNESTIVLRKVYKLEKGIIYNIVGRIAQKHTTKNAVLYLNWYRIEYQNDPNDPVIPIMPPLDKFKNGMIIFPEPLFTKFKG